MQRKPASGEAFMSSTDATLATDTINFDRNTQEYITTANTIVNKDNTLISKSGRYYVSQKKFQFLTAVTITNPTYVIKSNHFDYYTNSGHLSFFGPSIQVRKIISILKKEITKKI
jgi:hypothetical protein